MTFNLSALKAYIGGLIGTWGLPVGAFVIGTIEAATGFDLPPGIETAISSSANFIVGFIAVYFASNELGTTA